MTTSTDTKTTPLLFSHFVARKYLALSDKMQSFYRTPERHMANYVTCYGFSEWLKTNLSNRVWDEFWTQEVAHTYVNHGNYQPSEIPTVLGLITRYHNVELPDVEGLLTPKFWEDHAYHNGWQTTEQRVA